MVSVQVTVIKSSSWIVRTLFLYYYFLHINNIQHGPKKWGQHTFLLWSLTCL